VRLAAFPAHPAGPSPHSHRSEPERRFHSFVKRPIALAKPFLLPANTRHDPFARMPFCARRPPAIPRLQVALPTAARVLLHTELPAAVTRAPFAQLLGHRRVGLTGALTGRVWAPAGWEDARRAASRYRSPKMEPPGDGLDLGGDARVVLIAAARERELARLLQPVLLRFGYDTVLPRAGDPGAWGWRLLRQGAARRGRARGAAPRWRAKPGGPCTPCISHSQARMPTATRATGSGLGPRRAALSLCGGRAAARLAAAPTASSSAGRRVAPALPAAAAARATTPTPAQAPAPLAASASFPGTPAARVSHGAAAASTGARAWRRQRGARRRAAARLGQRQVGSSRGATGAAATRHPRESC
jgi:hypothetical protein